MYPTPFGGAERAATSDSCAGVIEVSTIARPPLGARGQCGPLPERGRPAQPRFNASCGPASSWRTPLRRNASRCASAYVETRLVKGSCLRLNGLGGV